MSKHTPGPWTVGEDGDVIWAERWKGTMPHVATVPFSKDPRVAADARLIAAAPDLLEALIYARKELQAYEEALNGEYYNSPLINAAIAKATGAQP